MNDKLNKLTIDDSEYNTEVPEHSIKPYKGMPDPSEIRAFIPGTIVDIMVSEDEKIEPGKILLLLDAMKMHNEICTEVRGRIAKIHVSPGEAVQKNQLLVSIVIRN